MSDQWGRSTWNAANEDPDAPIDMVLTPRERDRVALYKLFTERRRRQINAQDKARQDAVERGEAARLGVVWPEDEA